MSDKIVQMAVDGDGRLALLSKRGLIFTEVNDGWVECIKYPPGCCPETLDDREDDIE